MRTEVLSKIVVGWLTLLIIVGSLGLMFSINDVFYLKKILTDEHVLESEHDFFNKKNEIEYQVSTYAYLIYGILFLIWFYYTYKRAYKDNLEEAPFKPALVPFSFMIPIFNFFGPYKIMNFIWWASVENEEEVKKGKQLIKLWWFLSLASLAISNISSSKYGQAEYADEFLVATYFYLFYYVTSISLALMTIKIIVDLMKLRRTHR